MSFRAASTVGVIAVLVTLQGCNRGGLAADSTVDATAASGLDGGQARGDLGAVPQDFAIEFGDTDQAFHSCMNPQNACVNDDQCDVNGLITCQSNVCCSGALDLHTCVCSCNGQICNPRERCCRGLANALTPAPDLGVLKCRSSFECLPGG